MASFLIDIMDVDVVHPLPNARNEMIRGALQTAASRLVGQHAQESRGEMELHNEARH